MSFFIILFVILAVAVFNVLSHRFATVRDTTITYIAGQIGAGKSSYSVKLARSALKRGRPVYCTDYIQGCKRFDVTWLHDMRCPEGSLVIIDEAALKFNSREFSKISKDILAYFKKARHYKNDVVLISQTFSDSDKQIREVANRVLFMRKFGWLTLPVRVSGDITIGDDGQPCMKYKIGKFARPFIPALQGKYYNSWNDDEDRVFCPDENWDPESEQDKILLSDYGDDSALDETSVQFSEQDAKQLIDDFRHGKGIDLSKFFPQG